MANLWSQVPAIGFNPVRFVPPSRQQTILAFQIDSISVAASEKIPWGKGFTTLVPVSSNFPERISPDQLPTVVFRARYGYTRWLEGLRYYL